MSYAYQMERTLPDGRTLVVTGPATTLAEARATTDSQATANGAALVYVDLKTGDLYWQHADGRQWHVVRRQ